MKILAIESSCDETAAAVIENGNQVRSNIVASQMDIHAKHGGVIPELASRLHVEVISTVIEEALNKAELKLEDVDAIAVTQGPGLIGSLHVGLIAAKALAWHSGKLLIPIHHIAGHIYANQFVTELEYPLLALVVSGGHSELIYLKREYDFRILGSTQDDAVGEAYDKVARVMGLGYPGGPILDRLANEGKAYYSLPRIKTEKPLDFSFSGLKSAVMQLVKKEGDQLNKADLAYAFQEACVSELIRKTELAFETYPVKHFVLGGGVSANQRLRKAVDELKEHYPDIKMTVPPMWCCTDNAAMIGATAAIAFRHGGVSDLSVGAHSSMDLPQM